MKAKDLWEQCFEGYEQKQGGRLQAIINPDSEYNKRQRKYFEEYAKYTVDLQEELEKRGCKKIETAYNGWIDAVEEEVYQDKEGSPLTVIYTYPITAQYRGQRFSLEDYPLNDNIDQDKREFLEWFDETSKHKMTIAFDTKDDVVEFIEFLGKCCERYEDMDFKPKGAILADDVWFQLVQQREKDMKVVKENDD